MLIIQQYPNNYKQVDHLDGNKLNNNVENLEWVTPKENTIRAWKNGQAKYTKERKEKLSKIAKERWDNGMFRNWRAKRTIQFYGVQIMKQAIFDWLCGLIITGDIWLVLILLLVAILILVELYFWLLEKDKK